jgi:hypothetical protein
MPENEPRQRLPVRPGRQGRTDDMAPALLPPEFRDGPFYSPALTGDELAEDGAQ